MHKRRKVIARLLPVGPKPAQYPDFGAISRRIFGRKKTRKTGTEVVSKERGHY